jgi:hypothetical protein
MLRAPALRDTTNSKVSGEKMGQSKMTLPRFTDLRGIVRDIQDDPAYPGLANTIRRASTAQSCVSDLRQAETCCEALEALLLSPRKKGTMTRSTTENALLMTGVLLYARATSTSGSMGERGSTDISSKLDAAQLIEHEALLEVRNRALAHVYSRTMIADGVWHDDTFFLVETDQGWKPAAGTKRFLFHRPTFDRLRRQLPIAGRLVKEVYHKRLNRLTDLLSENPVEWAIFEKNLFDPIQFFGSEQGVLNALAGMSDGEASGLT